MIPHDSFDENVNIRDDHMVGHNKERKAIRLEVDL